VLKLLLILISIRSDMQINSSNSLYLTSRLLVIIIILFVSSTKIPVNYALNLGLINEFIPSRYPKAESMCRRSFVRVTRLTEWRNLSTNREQQILRTLHNSSHTISVADNLIYGCDNDDEV